jgi:aldehyde dehydrogenase (NAD+)
MSHQAILSRVEFPDAQRADGALDVATPVDGARIASLKPHTRAEADAMIERANVAFKAWRAIPAPRRGELVRLFGDELRAAKQELGALVTLESGKILQEGLGEVQEMIDICDFAVGLSAARGLTMVSE